MFVEYLDCEGTEWSLAQCASKMWGIGSCTHFYDVGINCNGKNSEQDVPLTRAVS